MIVNTFTFEVVGQCMHEEFIKKGIIPTSLLKKLSTKSDDIDGDKFAVLLEHLAIITPIEDKGKIMKYFAPSALSHAELPPASISEKVIPPSYTSYIQEWLYCPKGSLVVKLLKKDKLSRFKWNLKEDRNHRNQICLSIHSWSIQLL